MLLNHARPVTALLAVGLMGMGGLTACSSGSKATGEAASTVATPSASSAPGNARFGLFADPKVRQCLSAAGITVPSRTPGARPSGSARPSFTGAPPSGVRRSGGAGAFASGANGKIAQALKACGITIPARVPGAGGGSGAAPSAHPSGSPAST